MMDYQLNVPAILRRADELYGDHEIASRLSRLLQPRDRGEIARAARATAERHPFEKYVRETMALYERVLSTGS